MSHLFFHVCVCVCGCVRGNSVLEAIPFDACPDFAVDYVESEDVIGHMGGWVCLTTERKGVLCIHARVIACRSRSSA